MLPSTLHAAFRPRRHSTVAVLLASSALGMAQSVNAAGDVVISQVYGGGGNSSATYRNDFVELFNRSESAVDISGWSVQYASPTGTGNFASNNVTALSGIVQPGQYYLVQLASGGSVGAVLPATDASGTQNIGAAGGKLVLVNNSTGLACNGASTACSAAQLAQIVDLVGYGTANFYEAAAAGAPSNTSSAIRVNAGCQDNDNNAGDFVVSTPAPRNSATALHVCEDVTTSLRIHDIQGAAHISPHVGESVVNVPGIVTALLSNGFYFQDPTPDGDPATSEGLFVYTASAPTVAVGDAVLVSGAVSEYRPGGSDGAANLTTTELTGPAVTVQSSGNALPAATVIGSGGRVPPAQIIDDDASGDVETSGSFDAATDGVDFYESLEGMRVQINNAVAVGPRNDYGEIPVIGDNGGLAGVRSVRGGLVVAVDDFNPERVILDDGLASTPAVNVGDTTAAALGVLDYSFGNFKLLVTSSPVFASGGLAAEVTAPATAEQLTVGSFNVENLDPSDDAAKFATLAGQVVNNLRSPDIVALMEVQDNNGATNDAVVDADATFQILIDAIVSAGGPTYAYRQINPVDDQDGGEPGGNIRVGFLFNPARVSFVDRAGGGPTSAVAVVSGSGGAELSVSPGRIDPTHSAFANSRKPLAGEFLFNGHKLFVIANHFNSKGGDDPLFGHLQQPVRSSEVQRTAQAAIVADFVNALRAAQADAHIIVLGDLNDFEFSDTLSILKNAGLVDLVETLPANERYTYVYDGNSQALDHILVSEALNAAALPQYDVVHVNSEFATQASDHEPEVVRLTFPIPVAADVTSQVSVARSGLVYNRGTQTFNGTLQLTNTSATTIDSPIHVRIENLPAGVTLANASGTSEGHPYVTASASQLASGAQISVPVRFSNPARVTLSYSVRVFSGVL